MVVVYPAWKRRLWYLFSAIAMVPLLCGGVVVMTLSLNLNGYVQDKASPIYVGWLAQYAEPVSDKQWSSFDSHTYCAGQVAVTFDPTAKSP